MGVTSNGPDETRTVERLAYSPAEAARALGLARSSLYAALTRGDLRSVLVGEPEAVGDRLAITPGEECVTDT
jgi:hypothetical protein